MLRRGILYIIVLCITFSVAFTIGYKSNQDNLITNTIATDQIAIVNNDQAVETEEGQYLFGDFFIDYVNQYYSDDYDFIITNSNDAKQGLVSGKYGAEIIIPSNFTKSLLSYEEQKPDSTEISYIVNSDLSDQNYKAIDHFLNELLTNYRTDIAYMYVFAIFDDLHYTQGNLNVLEDNLLPVFEFIDLVHNTDITKEHKLELIEENTDITFEELDTSTINETISSVQSGVTENVTITKEATNNTILELSQNLSTYQESNDSLLASLTSENVDDKLQPETSSELEGIGEESEQINTLTDLVNAVDFTEVEQTDFTSNFEQIIQTNLTTNQQFFSLDQLVEQLVTDSSTLNSNLAAYTSTTFYRDFVNLVAARTNYYEQSQAIETCLASGSDSEARTCVQKHINAFESSYNNYNTYLQDLVDEASYHDDLSDYLNKFIGTVESTSSEEETNNSTEELDGLTSFNANVTQSAKDKNDQSDQEQVELSEDLVLNDLSITSTGGMQSTGQALITFDAVSDINHDLTIKVDNQVNIADYHLEQITGSKLAINQVGKQVNISNIVTGHYQLLIDIERETSDNSSLDLSSSFGQVSVNFPLETNGLLLDVEYGDGQVNYLISNETTKAINELNITNNLLSDLTINELQVDGKATDYQLDGEKLTITLANPLEVGQSVNLRINYNDYQASTLVIKQVMTINEQEFSDLLITNTIRLAGAVAITDADNMAIGEDSALEYALSNTSDQSYQVSQLVFTISSETSELSIDEEQISILVDDTLQSVGVRNDNGEITLNFASPVTINPESTITLNVPVSISDNSAGLKQTIITVGLQQMQVDNDELIKFGLQTKTLVQLVIPDIGDVAVEYYVDAAVCGEAMNDLSACNLEAGDTVVRKVKINNPNPSSVSNLLVSDDILTSGHITTTSDNTSYELDQLAGDNQAVGEPSSSDEIETTITSDGPQYLVSIPGQSQGIITQELSVSDNIEEVSEFENTIIVNNQASDQDLFQAKQTLSFVPVKLAIKDVEIIDQDGDDLISPNEQVIARVTIRNEAMRASIPQQSVTVSSNDLVDVQAISVVNEANRNVKFSQSGDSVIIDKKLGAGKERIITFNLSFKDFTASDSFSGSVNFSLRQGLEAKLDDEYEWIYSSQVLDYRALALALMQGSIHTSDEINYHNAISNGQSFSQIYSELITAYQQIDYLSGSNNSLLSASQNMANGLLSAEELASIQGEIGAGLNPTTTCSNAGAAICQTVHLYQALIIDQVANDEEYHKMQAEFATSGESFTNELTSINDSLSAKWEAIETSWTENSELWAQVESAINEKQTQWQEITSQLTENQTELLASLNLDSLIVPDFAQNLATLSQIPSEVNQLSSQKLDQFAKYADSQSEYYQENKAAIDQYVSDLQADDTYESLAEDFLTDEQARYQMNEQIIGVTQEILPNTQVEGMANKDVYEFIVDPFGVESADTPKEEQAETGEKQKLMLIVGALGLIIILFSIIYVIQYQER